MPHFIKCPICGTTLEISNEHLGQRLQCSNCRRVFRAAEQEPERAPAPQARPTRFGRNFQFRRHYLESMSRASVIVVAGIGAMLLIGCCGLLGIIAVLSGPESARVTEVDCERVQFGMTLAEVEAILGPGRPAVELNAGYKETDLFWAIRNGAFLVSFDQLPEKGGKVIRKVVLKKR